ncbi:ELM1/GtrOC1 family putative glycosyltransferase [Acinetobacter sp. ANC 5414]|uniref:ELM1/GtrOC1 family putative glycosyltransferase n=1 Tax=Acinetobacter sp. ANC 5414 TaxID=2731251 RepID=UPI00149026CD|nr:ELM1/GtrOC1 family putative glycosyltransferase [Acinetobacter sp. ANC 5414]NNH00125.1 hypothetical protein [Acinetobacter sp. ANC 5414]
MKKALFFVLTDGKPGHQTQSEGVMKLLTPHFPKHQIRYLNLKKVSKNTNLALRFLLNYFDLSSFLEHYISLPDFDYVDDVYIISAGGDTLVPNVLLKRYCLRNHIKAKNIILSSLRGVQPVNFDVIFTVNSELKDNFRYVYYPISPNKMVFSNLKSNDQEDCKNTKILILIGADTKDVKIGDAKSWFKLVKNIKTQYPYSEVILTTSRRTSVQFEKELMDLLISCPLTMNDKYYMYNLGNQIQIVNLILSSNFVLVSQDSGSMVSEVIMAEKKVLIVGNITDIKNKVMKDYFNSLFNHHLLTFIGFDEINFQIKLDQLTIENHSLVLSDKLKEALSNHKD